MEKTKHKNTPLEKLVFVLIGLAFIVITDLFILGGIVKVMDSYKDSSYFSSPVDIAALRTQHSSYMDEGIRIDETMLTQSFAPPRINESNLVIAGVVNAKVPDTNIPSIEELLLQEKVMEVANIEPAAGSAKGLKDSFSKDRKEPLVDDSLDMLLIEQEQAALREVKAQQQSKEPVVEEVKDVTQVIYDLGVSVDKVLTENARLTKASYEYSNPEGHGLIAIIIDDMGISLRSKQVEVLPYALTLSYLPYAKNLKERTKRAAANGHEIMLHMPMEPMNSKLDGGPKVLRTSQSEEEFIKTLEWGLSSFDGFVGLNNHMGSRLTKDKKSMQLLMDNLKGRSLFFIDSKTIGSSVAANVARDNGIAYASRDVFIDHEQTPEFLRDALAKLEKVAQDKGYAIAIGHPHKETIAALKEWLPTLEGKGLTLVPASKLVKYPNDVNDNLVAVSE